MNPITYRLCRLDALRNLDRARASVQWWREHLYRMRCSGASELDLRRIEISLGMRLDDLWEAQQIAERYL